MAELTSMMNIGRELANKLTGAGITSAEELLAVGARQAFARIKEQHPNVCLVHLYALEGAVTNTEFNALSREKKQELKLFRDALKRA